MKAGITVKTSSSSYRVTIGKNILEATLAEHFKDTSPENLFVLIDENVFKHHWRVIEPVLSNLTHHLFYLEVPAGENSKSVDFWSKTVDFLLERKIRRNTPLIVIGGGVTGDLGGFAAATVLRGIPLIHIPTTLLAMVDSSIGGKTGVNHTTGKNLIGAFYQPEAVIADVQFLDSLPENEWINGLSEILKYGAIKDDRIFSDAELFFEQNYQSVDSVKMVQLIARCVQIKADIVEADEFEGGIRAYLNYGHTFAHALEKACDFDKISHGEAVFLGMLAAEKLSALNGADLPTTKLQPFRSLYSYRISKDDLSYKKLNEYMKSDKKRTGQHITFVLLNSWQHPQVKKIKNEALINEAWDVVFNEL